MLTIRPATETDLNSLSVLYKNNFRNTLKSKLGKTVCYEYLKEIFNNPSYHLLIVCEDAFPAGLCIYHKDHSLPLSRKWLFKAILPAVVRFPLLFFTYFINDFDLIHNNDQNIIIYNNTIDLSNCFYIDFITVDKRYRRKNIGSDILNVVESLSINKGIKTLCLTVAKNNIEAFNFYTKNNFKIKSFIGKSRSYILYKELDI